MKTIKKPLLLLSRDGKRYVVPPDSGMRDVPGLGVVDSDRLLEAVPSGSISISGKEFFITEALLPDLLASIKRGPQIIMPKDAAQIIMGCGIGPGHNVLEVGTGSASLTIALAYSVGESGHVVTYEMNPRHAEVARRNIAGAGMGGIVEMREQDASSCQDKNAYDAAVLDMPEPWRILEAVTGAVKPGKYLCAYLPTMNQVETTINAMRSAGYGDTHVLENIQREIVVGPGGTRPSFEMLGHTGYLCFGRNLRV